MQDSQVAIQCTNHQCQTANPFNNKVCQKCGTPIVKRYLRVLGGGIDAYPVGSLIDDRYLIANKRVVIDLYPGLPPKIEEDLPKNIVSYLKLSPYKPQIPQIYGLVSTKEEREIWLLEYGTVPLDSRHKPLYPELLPEIVKAWKSQSPLRQLNWLSQMAQLWQPLTEKDAAATLLQPELLRFNGAILQILELELSKANPSLADLGRFWATWTLDCDSSIKEFCQELCDRLENGSIDDIVRLTAILTSAMRECSRSYQFQYRIFTGTDSGPTRSRNEDSCYPEPDKLIQLKETDKPLAIVCDGVGGHEGGEIASQLTIEYLTKEINNLSIEPDRWDSEAIASELVGFVCGANNIISDRNDSEKRHQRQRMGTTVVMTFARAHEIYLAHVGDSRIYLVTKNSCHQVTVDDDLASREVRSGYALYRDAAQYPSAGALVQALGMSSSDSLYPNIQRLVIDEDCVFLLCSDGLSDLDRVDQYWDSQIQTILNGKTTLTKAGKELIAIANERNGHDNVTVALVHCQVQKSNDRAKALVWTEIEATVDRFTPSEPRVSQIRTVNVSKSSEIVHPESRIILNPTLTPPPLPPIVPTQTSKKDNKWVKYLILFLSATVVGAVAYYILNFQLKRDPDTPSTPPPLSSPTTTISPETIPTEDSSEPLSTPDRDSDSRDPSGEEFPVNPDNTTPEEDSLPTSPPDKPQKPPSGQ
jgi:protein phosphatase